MPAHHRGRVEGTRRLQPLAVGAHRLSDGQAPLSGAAYRFRASGGEMISLKLEHYEVRLRQSPRLRYGLLRSVFRLAGAVTLLAKVSSIRTTAMTALGTARLGVPSSCRRRAEPDNSGARGTLLFDLFTRARSRLSA